MNEKDGFFINFVKNEWASPQLIIVCAGVDEEKLKSGLKNTKLRTMSALSKGDTPGPEASITKIVSAGKLQDIGNFGIDSLDMAGMLKTDDPDIKKFQIAWLGAPGLRIAGGTDEILRNIIAERVLGLPQEPRADKGLAYKDIPSGNS